MTRAWPGVASVPANLQRARFSPSEWPAVRRGDVTPWEVRLTPIRCWHLVRAAMTMSSSLLNNRRIWKLVSAEPASRLLSCVSSL